MMKMKRKLYISKILTIIIFKSINNIEDKKISSIINFYISMWFLFLFCSKFAEFLNYILSNRVWNMS